MVQEVNEEIPYSPSSKDKKPHAANRAWRWLRGKNGSTTRRTRTSLLMAERAKKLEDAIDHLVPAVLRQDLHCVHIFLDTYNTFASTGEELDQLCARFGCYYSTYEEVKRSQEQRDMAIYAILNIRVEKYPEDFVQRPGFPSLHTLLAYLQVYVPGSDLQRQAQLLLPERQRPPRKATEPEAGATAPAPDPDQVVPQEVVPAATLAPAAPLGPELAPTIPAAAAHSGSGRPVTTPPPTRWGQGR